MPTSSRLHRLAYYMIGLSIGLMMVGLIVTTRNQYLHQPDPNAPDAFGWGAPANPPPAPTAHPAPEAAPKDRGAPR